MRWEAIIIHHSATPDRKATDTESFERWHKMKGWRDIGYHWVVERLESGFYHAIGGRPMTMVGAHCPGWNSRALGVCFAGDFTSKPPPIVQLQEGAQLIAGLCYLGGISASAISCHRDHRETACPGAEFPMMDLRAMVADYLRVL